MTGGRNGAPSGWADCLLMSLVGGAIILAAVLLYLGMVSGP